MRSEYINNQPIFTQQVHLIDYINIIRRRKWIAIAFLLVVVATVAYKTYTTTPVYMATAQIIIEEQSSIMDKMARIMSGTDTDKEHLETQSQILKSRSLARRVIEDMGLREYVANKPRKKKNLITLAVNRAKSFVVTILSPSTSDTLETQSKPFKEQSKSEYTPRGKDWVVSWYVSKIRIVPIRKTLLFNISFMDESPELAARMANAHSRTFIQRNLEEQRLASDQALGWLKKQLIEQKIKVDSSQRKINEFKYEQLKVSSSSDKDIFSLPEIMENPIIQNLRSQLTKLRINKVAMATKYGPKHPELIEIKATIKKIEQEIITEMERVRMTIQGKLDQAEILEKSSQQAQDIQHSAADQLNGKTINYEMLRFEAESDQQIYDILLKQAKEISLTGNMDSNSNNIRIVDEAEIPYSPIKPNVFVNFVLSVIMGLAFGTGLAFIFEYMRRTEMTPEEVMVNLGMSVIGILPYDKSLKKTDAIALPLNESHHKQKKRKNYYARYNISSSLLASLPLKRSRKSGQVFIVESATAGEGKSTVLAKTAVSMAKGGLRVIMVDADLQRPTLHNIFGIKNDEKGGLCNAKKRILSHKILKGSLDEYSLDDIFSLIALGNQSGRLMITNSTQAMTAVFENGHLFHLQSDEIPIENRLGTMLLRGGFITESQLKDALERNKRTKQPLGYILINAGYINQDKLRGPVKLQIEECIHKLFSWKQGAFVFEKGNIEKYEDKRIYFQEDYTPIISRLGRTTGSRFLEKEILSYVKFVDEPNLALFPSGTRNENVEGPLYYILLEKIMDILKQHFDVVLIDAPPVLETMGSVKSLINLAEGIIFVVESGHVALRKVKDATQYLKEEGNSKIIGAILNKVKIGGGYYYGSYYK